MRHLRTDPSLLAVVGEGFFSRFSFGIVGFALPLFAYHIGLSMTAIGTLVALNVVAEMALKPFVAPLVDRYGTKLSLSVAVGLRSLVAFLLAFAAAPWQLFAIRVVHGASESIRDPSVNAIIAERSGVKTVASSFAWYNTAKVVAGALGKAAGGILLSLTVSNYMAVFLVAFLLSALPLFVVMRYVKDPDRGGLNVRAQAEAEAGGHERMSEGVQRALLPSIGFGVLTSGTAAMLSNLFPLLATKYAGLTEAQAGIVYLLSTLVIVFAGPLFGWLSDNVSRKAVLSARGVANTLSSVLYIFLPSFAGYTGAKIIDDMGKAAFRPAWGALMARISGHDRSRRARMLGYLSLAENIGETGGPLLAGFLWSTWGVVVMLTVRAVLSVITELYTLFMTRFIDEGDIRKER